MRAKPKLKQIELTQKLPKKLGGDQDPTPDSGHPDLDHHAALPDLDSDTFGRDGADAENRRLTRLIREALKRSKSHPERFVLTWRMYPDKDNPTPEGSCGCGCSCS
jgi:hypothetical protein